MTTTIEDLVKLHTVASTEREKAQIEFYLWAAANNDARQNLGHRRFMRQIIPNESSHKIELRFQLHNAGKEADPIWARVAPPERMPLPTAVGRLRAAQEYAKRDKISLTAAIKVALDEYDSWPWHRTRDNVPYRRRPMSQIGRERIGAAQRVRKSPTKEISEEKLKSFWLNLRAQIVKFYEMRLAGLDTLTANKLQREFCADLQLICDEHSDRINRERIKGAASGVLDEQVRFIRVKEACALLVIDPPKRGKPPDLKQANKHKKLLARQYHPDIAGPTKKEEYDAVMKAYTTLKIYTEQITRNQEHSA